MPKTNPKILIDIKHPAQLNLFKHLAESLKNKGWEVTVCYLQRGKLPQIIAREYAGFHTLPVGSSKGTKWSILWQGNVQRVSSFLKLIRKNHYDICVAASSAPLALACRLSGTPVIQFYDDPERQRINAINARLSDRIFFPPIVEESEKVGIFNCLKEWSYLSPARFTPDPSVTDAYGLAPYSYVFVREVSNQSFNYYDQKADIVGSFAAKIPADVPVLLSLEDKAKAHLYPEHWVQLQEPVGDIHSLMFHARLVLSSGDSMAREGAMLGTPSIYCGVREMRANAYLMQEGGPLSQHPEEAALEPVRQAISRPVDKQKQQEVRQDLLAKWDDMIAFMEEKINHYKK
ncbi:DUF354 domain-containing protein [Cyclobacterium sp. SYSU L10401]|uniref:DUF354 domain-containing protein n=1 Tax=Cyclobacterium sp. SYSU L10401 TaxID=2678657 RepID=UPI0013D22710|nr:DUF354 domain-containing protein [Cyclobacterium sp. SYSU L10401]